ncbi:hypothetical protein ACKAV7_003902 [Fusarium commune]
MDPSADKRRVRRACEKCRRKKVKGDGDEPCARCHRGGQICQYNNNGTGPRDVAIAVGVLKDRVTSMERILRQQLVAGRVDSSPGDETWSQRNIAEPTNRSPVMNMVVVSGDLGVVQEASESPDIFEAHVQSLRSAASVVEMRQSPTSDTGIANPSVTSHESYHADGFRELDPDAHRDLSRPEPIQDSDDLVRRLLHAYFRQLAFAFPVITEDEVYNMYHHVLEDKDREISTSAVVLSVLSAATPLVIAEQTQNIRSTDQIITLDSAVALYDRAVELADKACRARTNRIKDLQNIVTAYGFQALYLAETGSQAEAWVVLGKAIRRGQDLGLHILEVQLSTALGRPLTIHDDDCDVEKPTTPLCGVHCQGVRGFGALIELHKVLKAILKTINPIQNARLCIDMQNFEEIRMKVSKYHATLQNCAETQVPNELKAAKSGLAMTKRCMLLSCFSTAILLLYRCFMPNPHKASALESSQVQRVCSKNATDCIRGSSDFLQHVPFSHYYIFHGKNLFVGANVLLQCIRNSHDANFMRTALQDVGTATIQLRVMEKQCPGALRSRAIIDEPERPSTLLYSIRYVSSA